MPPWIPRWAHGGSRLGYDYDSWIPTWKHRGARCLNPLNPTGVANVGPTILTHVGPTLVQRSCSTWDPMKHCCENKSGINKIYLTTFKEVMQISRRLFNHLPTKLKHLPKTTSKAALRNHLEYY